MIITKTLIRIMRKKKIITANFEARKP